MKKLLMAAILWTGMAQAGWTLTVEERLVAGLEGQGYTVLEKGYTFLGRLRIVAENDEIHREIVVNPGTGEILRDYAIYISDLPPTQRTPKTAQSDTHDSSVSSVGSMMIARTRGAAPTGTADVAASALTPGSSTLGTANLEVDTAEDDSSIPLETTILPMTPGIP